MKTCIYLALYLHLMACTWAFVTTVDFIVNNSQWFPPLEWMDGYPLILESN